MHDLNELQSFYKNDLRQPLGRLEAARKAAIGKILMLAGLLITICLLALFYLPANLKAGTVILAVVSLIAFAIAAVLITDNWKQSFKSTIIPKLINHIEPGLSYDAEGKIEQRVFEASRLYQMRMYNYDGEDLVSGSMGGFEVSFCELDVTRNSSSKNNNDTTIFEGMFLVARIDSGIEDSVWLVPDIHQQLKSQLPQGMLGGMLEGLVDLLPKQSGERVTLDDTEFMSRYGVFAENEETARRLLTDDLRQHLIALQSDTGQEVRISFQPDQISVALSLQGDDLFDPRLLKTVLSYEVVRGFFEDFNRAYGIINAVRPVIEYRTP
jgi:hypothetical protein